MAVLAEAISVIVRRDSIAARCRGGWTSFVSDAPNATLCYDDAVARIGFMFPDEVENYIEQLESRGLRFLRAGRATDLAVVDQQRGLTTQCDWLEFARIRWGDEGRVSACWFFDGPRVAAGVHMKGLSLDLATPPGWDYQGSLSQQFTFIPSGEAKDRLRFLRREDGVEVYLDLNTGREVFIAGGGEGA